MPKRIVIAMLFFTAGAHAMAADTTTPQAALRALEDAYIRNDVDGAIAAKDFTFEARAMLGSMKNARGVDDARVRQTADVLELAFRNEMKAKGLPNFRELHCVVLDEKQRQPELVEMTEVCTFPDGGKSRQAIFAHRSQVGWRIVVLPD